MAGFAEYAVSGQLSYVKNNGLYNGRSFGTVSVRLNLEAFYSQILTVPSHGVFLSIRYNEKDMDKAAYQQFISRLQKNAYVLIRGAVKPRAASKDGKYPASLLLDAHWRSVSISFNNLPRMNRFSFEGEVVRSEGRNLEVKYSYNTRGSNPQWKDRNYNIVLASETDKRPRDRVYIDGQVFGINPKTQEDVMWLLGEKVF